MWSILDLEYAGGPHFIWRELVDAGSPFDSRVKDPSKYAPSQN